AGQPDPPADPHRSKLRTGSSLLARAQRFLTKAPLPVVATPPVPRRVPKVTSIPFSTPCAPPRLGFYNPPACLVPRSPRAGEDRREGRRAAVRTRAAAVRSDRAVAGRGPEVRLGGSLHRPALPCAAADHHRGLRRGARDRGPRRWCGPEGSFDRRGRL